MKKVKNLKVNKSYMFIFFILFSISVFSEVVGKKQSQLKKNYIKKENETVKVKVVDENKTETDNFKEEDIIYLEQIIDEKKVKANKKSKIEKAINKLDKKLNPVLRFYTPASYGKWYLVKTSNIQEAEYENIKYDFKQEENGYRIVKTYYIPQENIWVENKERGWISEKKGKVYLNTEKGLFKSYKNEIIYFDNEYKYMIIKFESDGNLRVFSRNPDGNVKLSIGEKEKIKEIINKNSNLKTVIYNKENKNPDDMETIRKKEQERRAGIIEERLNKNIEEFFKID